MEHFLAIFSTTIELLENAGSANNVFLENHDL
jgi:hypothetical protein